MVSAARAQEGVVPRNGANAPTVPSHGIHNLAFDSVPNLELSSVGSYGKVISIS